jgi:hypothetical protein
MNAQTITGRKFSKNTSVRSGTARACPYNKKQLFHRTQEGRGIEPKANHEAGRKQALLND